MPGGEQMPKGAGLGRDEAKTIVFGVLLNPIRKQTEY
jgi:hypothetical protein